MIRSTTRYVALSGNGDVSYSQPIRIAPDNACSCTVVVQQLTGSTPDVSIEIQVSHDRENWVTPSGASPWMQDVDADGTKELAPISAIVAPYMRFRYTLTGTLAIFSITVHSAKL
jgi:hypothetical protein